jgi:hypothetical protein
MTTYEQLERENQKLKLALRAAIPWIGLPGAGPSWATEEAKQWNRKMSDRALQLACDAIEGDPINTDS